MSEDLPQTYLDVHALVYRFRGPASDYTCPCGEPARDWAYQFTGDPELRNENGNRPHSLNSDDYEPMCRSCHMRFDLKNDPALATRYPLGPNAGSETIAEKWRSDMAYAEMMVDALSRGNQTYAKRMRTDPEFAEKMREGNRRGAQRTNAEYAERISETMRSTNSRRRRCRVCGLTSNPGGMGKHRLSSGHGDFEDLS